MLRLTVTGQASIDLLLRVLNLLVLRDATPRSVEAMLETERMVVRVVVNELSPAATQTTIEKLRALIGVVEVQAEAA